MNLVFVIKTLDSRGGGAERVLTQVTSELVKRGHQITLMTFGTESEPDFYPVDPAIRRIWLGIGDVQAPTAAVDLLRRIKSLRRAIREAAPDVAVGFMPSAYIPLAFALWGSGVPVIASEHIGYDYFKSRPLEAFMLRITAALYARMTIISVNLRAAFPGSIAKRMEVIPNPVATMRPRSGKRRGKRLVLLNVGRLVEQKDQQTLIRAFAQVADVHPDWILRIIGQGPLRARLERLVADLRLQNRVEFAGVIENMESEYAAADLFGMSSRYESFGLATAEALSAAVPAIGFKECPGTNELIEHDVNGLLVDGRDRVAALADGLDVLMGSPQLRKRMSIAALPSVNMFEVDAIGARWEALLDEVFRKNRP